MLHAPSFLIVALLFTALLSATWGASAVFFKVSRKSMLHWAASMVMLGLSTLLIFKRGQWPDYATFLGSDLCAIIGVFSLRRGMQLFTEQKRTDIEHLVLLVVAAGALTWMRADPERYHGAVMTVSMLSAYGLLATCREAFVYLRLEFNRTTSAFVLLPISLTGLLFVARLVQVSVSVGLPQDTSRTVDFGLFMLVAIVVQVLQSLSLAGVVVARLIARIHQLSVTDPLTGIANRRRLEEFFTVAQAQRRRSATALSVVMLDIDHFKKVNDTHGHDAGDAALVRTARIMKQTARLSDCVGRLGGEEFCVILVDTDAQGAEAAAQRLRIALEAEAIDIGTERALHITASFGTATLSRNVETWSDVLKRADGALYQAKKSGRNCVVVSETPACTPAAGTEAMPLVARSVGESAAVAVIKRAASAVLATPGT